MTDDFAAIRFRCSPSLSSLFYSLFVVDLVFQVLIFALLGWLLATVFGSSSSLFWVYAIGSYLLFSLL